MKLFPLFALLTWTALPAALAQTTNTWTGGNTTNDYNDATYWSPVGVPNGVDSRAVFTSASSTSWTNSTNTLGSLFTSGGTLTLGTTATASDVLRLETSSGTPVISNASDVFFFANLEGSQGFQKTGAGKFTFRFNGDAQNYTGNILINAGILGINQDSSLGDSNNGITISNGARLLAEPGSNSGTITLGSSRTITLAGVQSQLGSGNAAVDMVIEGNILETVSGNGLVKTDAGVVTLNGTLGYSGETRIAGGTLRLGASAALPTGQNLRFNGATGTLDVGSTSQTVRTIVFDNNVGNKTITGNGGSLAVNGDANQAFTTTANGVVYDLSGLSSFSYDRANREFGASATGANVTNNVNFARGANSITATNIRLGGGGANAAGQTTLMRLGATNIWYAGTDIFLGNFQGNAGISFHTNLTDPSLTIRGITGGSSAVPLFRVASTSSGNQPTTATLDLTGGRLDVVATELDVAANITATASTASTGTLTMPAGNVEVGTLSISRRTTNGTAGTPVITGTMNQSGGTVAANAVVIGNQGGGGAPTLIANYNLTGGELAASVISTTGTNVNVASVRNLNVNGGTVKNKAGGDLAINGAGNEAQNRLNIILGASGGTFEAENGRSINVGANTAISGTGGLTKTGAGSLSLTGTHTYTGPTLVSAGTLKLELDSSITSEVTVGAAGAIGGAGTIANTLAFDSGAKFVFSLTETLLVNGVSNNVSFVSFGIGDLIGLSSETTVGLYDLIGGTATINTNGLSNLGAANAFNLGGGKSAYFSEGSLQVNVVPEPSTYALLTLVAVGLGARFIRRRNRR